MAPACRRPVQSLAPLTVSVAAPPPADAIADAAAPAVLLDDAALQNDASLMLVASLSDGVDFDAAREAGLAPNDSAEHAITHMNDAELRELRRLLTEELARSGSVSGVRWPVRGAVVLGILVLTIAAPAAAQRGARPGRCGRTAAEPPTGSPPRFSACSTPTR